MKVQTNLKAGTSGELKEKYGIEGEVGSSEP